MRGWRGLRAFRFGRLGWALAALGACDPPPPGPDDVPQGDAVFDAPDAPDVSTDPGRPDAPDAGPVEAGPPADRGPLVPEMCADLSEHLPRLFNVDPRTNCPAGVAVGHRFSSPGTCDDVRACCNFAPTCEFDVALTLSLGGPCGWLDSQFPMTSHISGCRCVDGRISCNGTVGVITGACLDCPRDSGVAAPRDGG